MAWIQLAIEIKTYDLAVLQKPQKIRFILTMELTSMYGVIKTRNLDIELDIETTIIYI